MSRHAHGGPLHRQLADELRRAIIEGEYLPGAPLPSEHELSRRFGVARGTVRQALTTLRAEGAVASRKGSRWVVVGTPLIQSFSELLSFSAWARGLGLEPAGKVIELTRREARLADSERLGVAVGETVFSLVRLRLLGDSPVMVERTAFAEPVGSLLFGLDLERGSIYEQLGDHGVVFARARHTVDAIPANADDSRWLGVARRAPLLRERRASFSQTGAPLEWSDDRYRGDAVAFAIENTVSTGGLERLLAAGAEGGDPLGSSDDA